MSSASDIVDILLDLLEGLEEKLPYWLEQFPDFDKNLIMQVASTVDPTPNKVYTVWLLKQVRAGTVTPNNMGVARESLSEFDRYKRRADWKSPKDINQYGSAGEFYEAVRSYTGAARQQSAVKDVSTGARLAMRQLDSAEDIFNISQKTGWCTKRSGMATRYANEGPIYVVLKDNRPYVLIQPRNAQVKDIHDRSISEKTADEIAPLLRSVPKRAWMHMPVLSDVERRAVQQRRERFFNSIKDRFIQDETAKHGRAAALAAWEVNAQGFLDLVNDPPGELASEHNLSSGLEGGMLRLYKALGLVPPQRPKADPAHNPWNRSA
jgi:hypothetical protein